jgi:hypothetical protein
LHTAELPRDVVATEPHRRDNNLWPWMTLDDEMDGWMGQMMNEKNFTTTLHDHDVLYI